ncbi:MAG: hypothetical protein P8123_09970, partial [bacterium]
LPPPEEEVALGYPDYVVLDFANVATAGKSPYSLNFSAARPLSYDKILTSDLPCPAPSGGAGTAVDPINPPSGEGVDDATFGDPKDSVESLMPQDLGLGQIVPFEIKIKVSDDTTPDDGKITFVAGWSTETDNGGAFGYDPAYGVYCAFVDTSDDANKNLDGDERVTSYSWTWVDTSNPVGPDEIQGTFDVEGLDDGDEVVVEIWLVLQNPVPFPSKLGSNVTSRLISGTASGTGTISPDGAAPESRGF